MTRIGLAVALLAAVFAAPVATNAAGIPSALVPVGTFDQIIFDGLGFVPTPFDVYHVVVDNTDGPDLFTLEGVSFGGPWLQSSPVPIFSQMGTALPADPFDAVVPPVGDNFTPDTFFSYPGVVTPFADSPVDTGAELGGVTVAALGAPWVGAGATETIAVLTVPAGTPLDAASPAFFDGSGGFIVSGEIVPLMFIPEPGTMALAGLGLIGVMLRRRNK